MRMLINVIINKFSSPWIRQWGHCQRDWMYNNSHITSFHCYLVLSTSTFAIAKKELGYDLYNHRLQWMRGRGRGRGRVQKNVTRSKGRPLTKASLKMTPLVKRSETFGLCPSQVVDLFFPPRKKSLMFESSGLQYFSLTSPLVRQISFPRNYHLWENVRIFSYRGIF